MRVPRLCESQEAPLRLDVVRWRLMALSWAAVIFWMSTERFGGGHTLSTLAVILNFFHLAVPADYVRTVNSVLRKLAHLTEYAILAFFIYRSFASSGRLWWQPHLASWSIVTASVYSLSDEFHQAFVRGRHASLIDCAIDTLGSASAMLVVYAISNTSRVRNRDGFA